MCKNEDKVSLLIGSHDIFQDLDHQMLDDETMVIWVKLACLEGAYARCEMLEIYVVSDEFFNQTFTYRFTREILW
jgi:hypothetical protein